MNTRPHDAGETRSAGGISRLPNEETTMNHELPSKTGAALATLIAALILLASTQAFAQSDVPGVGAGHPLPTDTSPAAYCGLNPFFNSGYGGQCTDFCWGRAMEKLGISLPFRGNAVTWYSAAQGLYQTGSTPQGNSIAVWSYNGAGHVAFVEEVVGDQATMNEANILTYNTSKWGGGYDGASKTRSAATWAARKLGSSGPTTFLGYIYLTGHAPAAPAATTQQATSVTANSAQLNGSVNPNGAITTVYFQYGTTTSYGSATPSGNIGTTVMNNIGTTISGLAPGKLYHFCITASNSSGTSYGADMTFTTQLPQGSRPLGIDVSHYQGSIDWASVKAAGISFAWAKAAEATPSDGYIDPDPEFAVNEGEGKGAALYMGAYYFAHPELDTPSAAASYFWSVAGPYILADGKTIMPMLDLESDVTTASPAFTQATLSDWVNEWCQEVVNYAAAEGVTVKPVVYTYISYANGTSGYGPGLNSTMSQWPLWMANYNNEDPQTGAPSSVSPWTAWGVWQYSDAGSVPGVAGNVDEDVFNGSLSQMVATLVATGGQPPVLAVSPSDGLSSSGNQGGPFSPASKAYAVSNTGGGTLNWTAAADQNWVTVSQASGQNSGTVTVSINANANSFSGSATGTLYASRVTFAGNAGSTTRQVQLTVTYTPPPVQISGNVHTSGGAPVAGVVMSGLPGNPTTDSSGNYSAQVSSGWSGTVTPSLSGYTFNRPSRSYGSLSASQSGQDYVATAPPVQISGNVHSSGGAPVAGVVMSGLPGNPTTDSSGNYSAQVALGWSGIVTPTLAGYSFTPPSRNYSGVTANQGEQDYVATPTGSLSVTIGPAAAVTAGAEWEVDPGGTDNWQTNGATVSGLSAGSHTVHYKWLTGWTPPSDQNVTVVAGATTHTNGQYTPYPPPGQTGSLQVTMTPPGAVSAGAEWEVDPGGTDNWQTNGATVTGLPAGIHTVHFKWIGTEWYTPPDESVMISAGATASTNGAYKPTGHGALQVTISPTGVISAGARWRVDGGAWESSGTRLYGQAPGQHTVSFSSACGWTTPPDQTVTIAIDQATPAAGWYVPAAPITFGGTYSGLFYDETNGVAPQSSGCFTLTATAKRSFSGNIQLGGARYALSGQFDTNGHAAKVISRGNLNPLNLDLQLDLCGGGNELDGSIIGGTWSADLTAHRYFYSQANPAPQAGRKYTLVIPGADDPSTGPGGYGFGTLSVNASGTVSCCITLGDGNKVVQSSAVGASGQWPLYISLYGGNELVQGWLSFVTNGVPEDVVGQIAWLKEPGAGGKLYPSGFLFTSPVDVIESLYSYSSRTPVLGWTQGVIELEGGNLTSSLANAVTLNANSRFTGTNKLSLTLTTSSGVFQGTVPLPGSKSVISVSGVLLQGRDAGYGLFQGPSQSGSVWLRTQ